MPLPIDVNLVGIKDQQSVPYSKVKGRWFTPTNQQFLLAPNVITTAIVPTVITSNQIRYIVAEFTYRFNSSATAEGAEPDVWVLPDASPAVTAPTIAGVVVDTQSELNPTIRPVNIGQTLQFLTTQTGVVVCISYVVPQFAG